MREAGNLIAVLEQSPGETVKSSHLLAPNSSAKLPLSSLSVQISYFSFNPLR